MKIVINDLELYESEGYVDRHHKDGGHRISQIIDRLEFKGDEDVVDYACGNGLLALELSKMVRSYTGVDFSSRFIAEAQKLISKNDTDNASFYCMDILELAEKTRKNLIRLLHWTFQNILMIRISF